MEDKCPTIKLCNLLRQHKCNLLRVAQAARLCWTSEVLILIKSL